MQEADTSTGLAPGDRAGLQAASVDRLQASPEITSQPARATWQAEKTQWRDAGRVGGGDCHRTPGLGLGATSDDSTLGVLLDDQQVQAALNPSGPEPAACTHWVSVH